MTATTRKPTRADKRRHLAKVEAEYRRVMAEIAAQPEGNGFATQERMRKAASEIYVGTICSLRRQLGIY